MLMVGCQKDEINTEEELLIGSELVSEERCIPRCEDCPTMTHCCCEVRVTDGSISLNEMKFCGDFTGCGPLSPGCLNSGVNNCPPIDGIFFTRMVDVGDTVLVCITQNEAFIIRNESTTDPISIEIECQQSSGPPTVIPIDLEVGEFAVIDLDGGCIPDQCN